MRALLPYGVAKQVVQRRYRRPDVVGTQDVLPQQPIRSTAERDGVARPPHHGGADLIRPGALGRGQTVRIERHAVSGAPRVEECSQHRQSIGAIASVVMPCT